MRVLGSRMRRAGPVAAGLFAALLIFGLVPAVGAQTFEVGEPIELRGSATGQVAHVTAVESGGTRLANSDVAWSGAVVDADADGVNGAKLNEMNRIYQPDVGNKLSYARGSGLEVGLGTTPEDENQVIIAGKAEQTAPPDNDTPTTEEIAVEGDPLAYASTARGQALARSQDGGLIPEVCVIGDDLARGIGYVEDAQLIDAGGDEASPQMDSPLIALGDVESPAGSDRHVSQSTSRTVLVPTGLPNNFGLASEVRQTIAPITLLQATTDPEAPRLLTIELLGEWVLRVVATGQPGGASVFYGPGETSPDTPILRIIDSANEVSDILSFQDIFGEEGFTAITIPGVLELHVGEDPRAISEPGQPPDPASQPELAADGTSASAAVDVLRLRLLSQPDPQAADIRIGHMEVRTQVPAGGVNCPIPVTKTADPRSINLGESGNESEITITVHNVFDCDLTDVVLTDRIRQLEGDPDFRLVSADPAAESPSMPTGDLTTADVVWQLGDIPSGEERSVTLILQSATKGGIIRDIAEATGTLANCAGQDVAGLAIAGLDVSGLSNPVDIAIPLAVTGVGGVGTPAAGAALSVAALGMAAFLRRRRR